MSTDDNKYLAAIDIGTNSIHTRIAHLENGALVVDDDSKESTRLGLGLNDDRVLSDESIERAVSVLERAVGLANNYGAEIIAVATSAVRSAKNQADFVLKAMERTGILVNTISGSEEGRLIHLGVSNALQIADRPSLVFDIGGGSTEIILDSPTISDPLIRSLRLGCISLTRSFFEAGHVDAGELRRSELYVRGELSELRPMFAKVQPEIAVGASGTVRAVLEASNFLQGENPKTLRGASFSASELEEVYEAVLSTSVEDRQSVLGLDEKRTDIIVGGIVLLRSIVKVFRIEEVVYSDFALREGILFDKLLPSNEVTNLKLESARKYAENTVKNGLEHEAKVAQIAGEIFEGTKALHGFGPYEAELLEIAALLHTVGHTVSFSARHKHSYHLIRHTDQLHGFNDNERELVAQVARFSRKALPTNSVDYFEALSSTDQNRVKILAGILRLAAGLTRGTSLSVNSVTVSTDAEQIHIELDAGDQEVELEIYSALEQRQIAEDAFDRKILISQV